MVAGAAFFIGAMALDLGLWQVVGIILVFLVCTGLTYPNAASLALQPFSRNIGSASSLLGFIQLGVGSVAAAVVGLLDIEGTTPLAVVMCTCSLAAWIVLQRSILGSRAEPRELPGISSE
jgi:DHA1 family bicyclomycin/chloramphenicol resistance-like MFS transporter